MNHASQTGLPNPLVSVYLPTRNRSQLVARAIESVLAQSYAPIELIVVDDCSEDDTEAVVRRYITSDAPSKRVVYFRLDTPSGACAARNKAIKAANGTLITGLDDDDYFLPDRIARLVQAFDPDTCAFVFDGYMRKQVSSDGKARETRIRLDKPAELAGLLKRNIVGNQVLTLTERMRRAGGFDVALPAWQDYDLWLRLVQAFGPGMPLGGVSYVQTIHPGAPRISGDVERIKRAYEIFLNKHEAFRDRRMQLFLKLAKASYGIDALHWTDLVRLAGLGEPRIVASSLYFYLRNRLNARQ